MKNKFLMFFLLFVVTSQHVTSQAIEFRYSPGNSKSNPTLIPYRVGNLWGYSNIDGKIIVEPKYVYVNFFYGPIAVVEVADSIRCTDPEMACLMIIDRRGNTILPVGSYQLWVNEDTTVYVHDQSGNFVINYKGEKFDPDDERIRQKPNYYFTGEEDEYYAMYGKDTLKKMTYAEMRDFGYKDVEGIIRLNPYNMHNFNRGFAHLDSSWGNYFSDVKGNRYLGPNAKRSYTAGDYHSCPELFENGYGILMQNEKAGVVDTAGNWVVPIGKYSSITNFSDGMALAEYNGDERVFINTKGVEMKSKSDYYFSDEFKGGFARIEYLKGKYIFGFIDKKGRAFPLKKNYEEVWGFSEGLCMVRNEDGKYGFIDTTGAEVIPVTLEYDGLDKFSDGMCRVKKSGLYGFIDRAGKEIIAPQYEEITEFHYGIAYYPMKDYVVSDMNYGINKKGEKLPYSFRSDAVWINGFMKVSEIGKSGITGVMDRSFNLVIPFQDSYLTLDSFGLVHTASGYWNAKTGMRYFKD